MKLLFFLITFSLHAQVLTFNPFSNKIFQWDGETFTNAYDSTETYTISFSDVPNIFQAPVAYSATNFYAATNDGKIFTINLDKLSATSFYESEDQCQMALFFSGCIYSLALTKDKELLFLTHQQDGSDTLMINRKEIVTNVPGPSGPIWIRPNGNIGLLPYGHGIYEIALPTSKKDFSEVLLSEISIETMAGSVMEANVESDTTNTYIFDFSTIKMITDKGTFATFAETSGATFDPCFGHVWYFDEIGEVKDFDLSPNPAACSLTLKWSIEEKTSDQGSPLSDASRFWDLPQGTDRVPNTMVFSLGHEGSLTLVPTKTISDSEGIDIRIFENPFTFAPGKVFTEAAQVDIYDGNQWVSTKCDCNNPSSEKCAGMQPTTVMPGSGIIPWKNNAGGFGVDLESLGISTLSKLKLTDCGIAPNLGSTGGFDLDAIAINPNSLN